MFKNLLTILLLAAFSLQAFHQSLLVADYYINTSSFAVHCENKAKPQLHCNGHCQLMKKMKTEENKDKQNPNRRENNKNQIIYFCEKIAGENFQPHHFKQSFISFNNSSTQDFSSSFFRPPKA